MIQVETVMASGAQDQDAIQRVRAELVTLLEHQRTLYRRLAILAERQRSLVMVDDPQPLLDLLSERQRLVDGLSGLNARLAPFRRHWTDIYQGLDESARKRVADLLEEANQTLGAILHSDRRDCETLSTRKQLLGEQLETVGAGRRASAAYVSPAPSGAGRLTDAEG